MHDFIPTPEDEDADEAWRIAPYAEQEARFIESFEPVMSHPMVAYHGSLQMEWGLYFIPDERDMGRLKAVGGTVAAVDGSFLRGVRPQSMTMLDVRYYPATGEIR